MIKGPISKLKVFSKDVINAAIKEGIKTFVELSDMVSPSQTAEVTMLLNQAFRPVTSDLVSPGIVLNFHMGVRTLADSLDRVGFPMSLAGLLAANIQDELVKIDSEVSDLFTEIAENTIQNREEFNTSRFGIPR